MTLAGALPHLGGGIVLGAVIVVGARVSGLVALLCLLVGSAARVLFEERAEARETVRKAR